MSGNKHLYEFFDSIGNLGELNFVLNSLKSGPLEKWVLKSCIYKHSGESVRIPLAGILIDFSIQLGLTNWEKRGKKEIVSLSKLGQHYVSLGKIGGDRLSKMQGMFLLEKVLINSVFVYDFVPLVDMLNFGAKGVWWINCRDVRLGSREERVLRILQQLRLAQHKETRIIISEHQKHILISLFRNRFNLKEIDLLRMMERRRVCGIIAEEFVLSFEERRLSDFPKLAKEIVWVSPIDVAAGFDIESFSVVSRKKAIKRFVEVKGYSGGDVCFFWSRNELEVSKILGDQYYLYLVDISKTVDSAYCPRIISNPYENVFINKRKWNAVPESYLIEMK